MNDEMMTIGEAVEAYGISRTKLWRWIKDGRLTAYQGGRDLRERLVRRADLDRLFAPVPLHPIGAAAEDAETGKRAA